MLLRISSGGLELAEMHYATNVKLFTNEAVPGCTRAVAVVSFLFGILFIMLGVLGEYLGRVLLEVRGRPRFLVREEVGAYTGVGGSE